MERIFIERENSIAYAVLAINSIYNSANKERNIDDFIEEIKTMFNIYESPNQLKSQMKNRKKLIITVDMKTK
mgnify:CR=1 FL=1